jgi:hypothetical protein
MFSHTDNLNLGRIRRRFILNMMNGWESEEGEIRTEVNKLDWGGSS